MRGMIGAEKNHRQVGARCSRVDQCPCRRFVDSFSRDVRDVAADSASIAAGRIRDTAYESTERLEEAIRQRPLTSMAIAVGIGCLLSLLVHRR